MTAALTRTTETTGKQAPSSGIGRDHACPCPPAASPVPVVWMRGDQLVDIPARRRALEGCFVGFCGYSHRAFMVSNGWLAPLLVQTMRIDIDHEPGCQNGARWLAIGCPFNQTTPEWLSKTYGPGMDLERLRQVTEPRYCKVFQKQSRPGTIISTAPRHGDAEEGNRAV